jgi:Family of unknown function (DUF6084)
LPDLQFQIEGAEAIAYAAAPMLALKLGISNSIDGEPIHTVALNCQVQIEPARRHYDSNEQEKLLDLFGEPERWSRTVRPLLWMNTSVSVPAFTDSIVVDLPLPCSFDFNVATTKYFHGLEAGNIPICVLFSGTVFYCGESNALQVAQVPWNLEANYRIPVAIWKQMMDQYYPNSAWLRLEKGVFDRLYMYKVRHGIPTWEQLLDTLVSSKEDDEVPV